MNRVDPSPVLFYLYFFYLIQVDPTRTGGPSWSGPTFVPAFLCVCLSSYETLSNDLIFVLKMASTRFCDHVSHFWFTVKAGQA